MQLNIKDSQLVTSTGDDFDGIDYGVDQQNMGMALRAFTQYADAPSSIVREITSNCFDSHTEASKIPSYDDETLRHMGYTGDLNALRAHFAKWKQRDVEVRIVDGDSILGNQGTQIEFEDFGVGLSPLRIKKIYTRFFSSTKRLNNDQIGAFGLGSKSPLGYTNIFEVITVFFGIEYHYIVQITGQAPELKVISQHETTKPNGTIVRIPIEPNDVDRFRRAIKTQLAYFDGLTIVGVKEMENTDIFVGKTFKYRPEISDSLHICLGKVYYPLSWNQVYSQAGVTNNVTLLPVALQFEIGELDVVWNRESIEYTQETIRVIASRVKAMVAEFQGYVDERNNHIKTGKDLLETLLKKDTITGFNDIAVKGVIIPKLGRVIDGDVYCPAFPSFQRISPSFVAFAVETIFTKGSIIEEGKTVRGYDGKLKASNVWNQKAPLFLLGDEPKSNPYLNKFLAETHPTFYVGQIKSLSEYTTDVLNSYGKYRAEDIKKFYVELVSELVGISHLYDRNMITEEWKEANKTANKTAKTKAAKEKLEGEMSYKVLYSEAGESGYSWKMRTIQWTDVYKKNPTCVLARWLLKERPVVYVTQKTTDGLENHVALSQFHMDWLAESSTSLPANQLAPLFISISEANVKHIKGFNSHVMSLKKWNKIHQRRFQILKTLVLTERAFKDLPHPTASCFQLIPEYVKAYQVIERLQIAHKFQRKFVFSDRIKEYLCKHIPGLYMPVVEALKTLVALEKKYPLLALNEWENPVQRDELLFYVNQKGTINPLLLLRLEARRKQAAKRALELEQLKEQEEQLETAA